MKRLIIALALPLLLTAGTARAERPMSPGVGVTSTASYSELKVTPEMWFYDQAMREYKDRRMAVRRHASSRRTTAATAGKHEMVRLLEQPSASQQRPLPR